MEIPRFNAAKLCRRISDSGLIKTDFIRRCIATAVHKNYKLKPTPQYIYRIMGGEVQPSVYYIKLFCEVLGCKAVELFETTKLKIDMKGERRGAKTN